MNKFKDKLAQFMYGRHGADQLYYALIVLCFILMIVNMFVGTYIIDIVMFAVLIWGVFRAFSRNDYKRRRENEVFMKFWGPVKAKLALTFRRIKESKTHIFRKCPGCKKVIRLPRKKGTHTVSCPCCHNKFQVKVLF